MYKLLIADDEQWIRQGLKEVIDWESCDIGTVLEADNGERALDIIRQTEPDVVITDICMPGIDGISLSSILKQEYPGIKAIIISGYKDFNYAREAIFLSVCDYILKLKWKSPKEIESHRQVLIERLEQNLGKAGKYAVLRGMPLLYTAVWVCRKISTLNNFISLCLK